MRVFGFSFRYQRKDWGGTSGILHEEGNKARMSELEHLYTGSLALKRSKETKHGTLITVGFSQLLLNSVGVNPVYAVGQSCQTPLYQQFSYQH